MKTKKQWMTLFAIGLLSAGILAGCGNGDTDATTNAGSSAVESVQNEENTDTIGEVKSNDGETLSLEIYKSNKKITNYMNMDGVTLKATNKTTDIDIEDDAVIERVEGDEILPIDAEDIDAGDMVAVSENSDGTQRIVVFVHGENNNNSQIVTSNETDNDDRDTEDTDDSEDKDTDDDQNSDDQNANNGTDANGNTNQGTNGQDANSGHQGGNNGGTTVNPGGTGDQGGTSGGNAGNQGGSTVTPDGGSGGGTSGGGNASGSENTGTVVTGNSNSSSAPGTNTVTSGNTTTIE
ncbi:MAG: hypothetical protein Q4C56_00660 [Peptococcaceae bacterium]|nr:hypothetical protein [Peptococcaceae bacterium]